MNRTDLESDQRPTTIHRAIDQVTILKIDLYHLQHHLQTGEPIDPERLARMNAALDQVTALLVWYRDQETGS